MALLRRHARRPGAEPTSVQGVAVYPPVTKPQAERLATRALLADEPDGLRAAWSRVDEMWTATMTRALQLPREQLDKRVDDEWSFLETLRHLIYVTDGWIGAVVLGNRAPHHPIGIPPDFVTNAHRLGINVNLRPTAEDIFQVRAQRSAMVREVISGLTPDDLSRHAARRFGWFTVIGALQVVIFEEWAHHEYATRDLTRLKSGSQG